MKMYKIDFIMELLQEAKECDNSLVGFEFSDSGNLVLCVKELPGGNPCAEEIEILEHDEIY